jgi:prepilin-type N-terminal cleavage/methylation domain-containing protein
MGSNQNDQFCARRGFTLIELLAAMTILVILVLMLTRVYTEGANAIQMGKRSTDRNVTSRAVMDFIARELSMMTFDYGDVPASNFLGGAYYSDVRAVFGMNTDEISFITLVKNLDGASDDGEKRSAWQIRYFVDNWDTLTDAPEYAEHRYALWRHANHPMAAGSSARPPGAYLDVLNISSLAWMGPTRDSRTYRARTGMLIDNVRTFEVFVYTDENGASIADWQSFSTNTSPKMAFMDIYLETMDERDAKRAALLASNLGEDDETVIDFVNRSVKRNYRRIHLHNKMGWQDVPR